ncbi:MAG TPA: hypothetical protein VHC19_10365 [Pirellulales bacterium]|nr:hypothetical protein [Pirellulales bacterium]
MTKQQSNLNRPNPDALEAEGVIAGRHRPDEVPPNQRGPAGSGAGDRHAAGAPAGGSAARGLAGTNVGRGDPDGVDIDAAGGGSELARAIDSEEEVSYSGPAGGAVGGTPANKRATEGSGPPQIQQQGSQGESTIGRNPPSR